MVYGFDYEETQATADSTADRHVIIACAKCACLLAPSMAGFEMIATHTTIGVMSPIEWERRIGEAT